MANLTLVSPLRGWCAPLDETPDAVFAQRLQAYLYYEALVGVSDVSSNSIALGLRGQF